MLRCYQLLLRFDKIFDLFNFNWNISSQVSFTDLLLYVLLLNVNLDGSKVSATGYGEIADKNVKIVVIFRMNRESYDILKQRCQYICRILWLWWHHRINRKLFSFWMSPNFEDEARNPHGVNKWRSLWLSEINHYHICLPQL